MKTEFKIEILRNKSTTYMLPFIGEQVGFEMLNHLLNSYLSFEEDDDTFCVLYQWDASPEFRKYEGKLMANHLYVGHEDYGDKVLYKFRLSLNMKKGRDLFIAGKHSEFSDFHKECIIRHLEDDLCAPNTYRIKDILNPDDGLTSVPPDMKKETWSNHVRKIAFKIDDFKHIKDEPKIKTTNNPFLRKA